MAKKVNNEETEKVKKNKKVDKKSSIEEIIVEAPVANDLETKSKTKKTDAKSTKNEASESKSSEKIKEKKSSTKKEKELDKSAIQDNESTAVIRYSDEDLLMFAQVINEAKTEALDEYRMLKERLDDLTSFDAGEESMIYSMHMAEQGSEAQEKEKTYAQIQRIQEHIKKLDDAMDRIRNKTYGICRVCSCLIAKERLLAVPITTLSASYKIHSKCPDDGIDKIEPIKF